MKLTIPTLILAAIFLSGCANIIQKKIGDEEEYCFPSSTALGESVRSPDGKPGKIKAVLGPSNRCTNPDKPIRAIFVPVTETSLPTPARFQTKITLSSLPAGWESAPWGADSTTPAEGRVALGTNKPAGAGFLIVGRPKAAVVDMVAYIKASLAESSSQLSNTATSAVNELTINGKRAYRYSITGTLKNNVYVTLTFMITVIEGETEYAFVTTYLPAAGFKENQNKLEAISYLVKFNEPVRRSSPSTSVTTVTTAPANQMNSASTEIASGQCLKMGFNAQTKPFDECVATLSK